MPFAIPQFGKAEPGVVYELRPGGYAVIFDRVKMIAVVKAPGGLFLPGGKQEPGETAADAAIRKSIEECGLKIEVGACLGIGDELVYADTEDRHYRKRGTFFVATAVGTAPATESDHELLWLPARQALEGLLHGSQRWAVASACRLMGLS